MRSNLARAVLAAVALAAAVAPPARAASRPDLARLAQAAVEAGVPGLAVGVRERGRTTVVARGRIDTSKRAALRATNRFRVGSVTKPMTAVVLLRLAERGRLSLDDPVERWVPGLLASGATTTVRQLLNHTSGLGEYYDPGVILKPYLEGNLGYVWDPRDLVRRGVAAPPPRRGPSGFAYTDTNYVLAGLVAEAAGGRPFGDLLREQVVEPLHLRRTSYPLRSGLPSGLAHGYADAGTGRPVDVSVLSPSIAHASGAVVSDVRDLLRFERGLLHGPLLSAASRRALRAGVAMGPGFPAGDTYGLGLWRTTTFGVLPGRAACGTFVGHDGEYPGFTSYAFARPDGRRGFALLVSSDALTARQRAAVARVARAAAC